MIRALRKKHKIIWLIVAIILPIIFIAGITFRHAETTNESIPRIKNKN